MVSRTFLQRTTEYTTRNWEPRNLARSSIFSQGGHMKQTTDMFPSASEEQIRAPEWQLGREGFKMSTNIISLSVAQNFFYGEDCLLWRKCLDKSNLCWKDCWNRNVIF